MGKSHLGDSAQKNHEMTAVQPTSDYDFIRDHKQQLPIQIFLGHDLQNKTVMLILEVRYYSAIITKIIGMHVTMWLISYDAG